jgi:hypothetical protein
MMSPTRFKPEDSSSGRRLDVHVRYDTLKMLEYQSVRYWNFYEHMDMNIKNISYNFWYRYKHITVWDYKNRKILSKK